MPSRASAPTATAVTWRAARASTSARRSASSPRSRSASRARSSRCVPSTSAASARRYDGQASARSRLGVRRFRFVELPRRQTRTGDAGRHRPSTAGHAHRCRTAASARRPSWPTVATLHVTATATKVEGGEQRGRLGPLHDLPIITEIAGAVQYEDLDRGRHDRAKRSDEATGIVQQGRRSTRARAPRTSTQARDRAASMTRVQAGQARRRRSQARLPPADRRHPVGRERRSEVTSGDIARAYPARRRQDPRHHGRSAARGRTVRSPSSEGSRRSSPISTGNVGIRPSDYKNKRRITYRAGRRGRRAHGISDPEGQAH